MTKPKTGAPKHGLNRAGAVLAMLATVASGAQAHLHTHTQGKAQPESGELVIEETGGQLLEEALNAMPEAERACEEPKLRLMLNLLLVAELGEVRGSPELTGGESESTAALLGRTQARLLLWDQTEKPGMRAAFAAIALRNNKCELAPRMERVVKGFERFAGEFEAEMKSGWER